MTEHPRLFVRKELSAWNHSPVINKYSRRVDLGGVQKTKQKDIALLHPGFARHSEQINENWYVAHKNCNQAKDCVHCGIVFCIYTGLHTTVKEKTTGCLQSQVPDHARSHSPIRLHKTKQTNNKNITPEKPNAETISNIIKNRSLTKFFLVYVSVKFVSSSRSCFVDAGQ